MEWQPFKTAPKNGKSVLVYDYYHHGRERHEDGRLKQTGPDGFGPVVARFDDKHGWHVSASVVGGKQIKLTNPTHWMPLPEPPK